MKADLLIKTLGIQSNNFVYTRLGQISVFPNGDTMNGKVPFINVDAFEGAGETYRRREGNCHIEINDGSEAIFSGSFEELRQIIKQAEIFKHNQSWCLVTAADLNDIDREYISHKILEGYTSGEVIHDEPEYEVVTWPDSQRLMEMPWFEECILINDENAFEIYGSSAYYVPVDRFIEFINESGT